MTIKLKVVKLVQNPLCILPSYQLDPSHMHKTPYQTCPSRHRDSLKISGFPGRLLPHGR